LSEGLALSYEDPTNLTGKDNKKIGFSCFSFYVIILKVIHSSRKKIVKYAGNEVFK
jgi:hypothetical protein